MQSELGVMDNIKTTIFNFIRSFYDACITAVLRKILFLYGNFVVLTLTD